MLPASIPSPSEEVWHLGPVPIRAYALAIVVGILVAVWIGSRRWVARGGSSLAVSDVALWAVPFGIIGARIYHVITDNQLYFGADSRYEWYEAFFVWQGGIGIWGAISGGALGVWIACRRAKIPFPAMGDALAPGILVAQGIGRWGNYFNQELYGRPTDLPWGLEIDPAERPEEYRADPDVLFHPTFLYESLWAFGVALLLIWADRRFKLGHGRVIALYVAGYTLGRSLFEYLRIDPANEIFGLRVNQWVAALVFIGAVVGFIISARRHPGREAPETLLGVYAESESAQASDDESGSGDDEKRGDDDTSATSTAQSEETAAGDTASGDRSAATTSSKKDASDKDAADGPAAGDASSDDAAADGDAAANDARASADDAPAGGASADRASADHASAERASTDDADSRPPSDGEPPEDGDGDGDGGEESEGTAEKASSLGDTARSPGDAPGGGTAARTKRSATRPGTASLGDVVRGESASDASDDT
ncbi:prolipoprotein diacylglyceryl transferase [Phytoactinopolyspora halotolerans]|uniref:Phosphatidylglycerol--prolipoprotein diacylglyceryl transferase n=2 Tax=Phytoactinopolyspora halotolerans TaxID=1981512 RepID=A0A6L9SDW1_9ACTN|nr:prolipoprotein diacylglyceryl transferase [Phytoactinopolyspora halotolerans]